MLGCGTFAVVFAPDPAALVRPCDLDAPAVDTGLVNIAAAIIDAWWRFRKTNHRTRDEAVWKRRHRTTPALAAVTRRTTTVPAVERFADTVLAQPGRFTIAVTAAGSIGRHTCPARPARAALIRPGSAIPLLLADFAVAADNTIRATDFRFRVTTPPLTGGWHHAVTFTRRQHATGIPVNLAVPIGCTLGIGAAVKRLGAKAEATRVGRFTLATRVARRFVGFADFNATETFAAVGVGAAIPGSVIRQTRRCAHAGRIRVATAIISTRALAVAGTVPPTVVGHTRRGADEFPGAGAVVGTVGSASAIGDIYPAGVFAMFVFTTNGSTFAASAATFRRNTGTRARHIGSVTGRAGAAILVAGPTKWAVFDRPASGCAWRALVVAANVAFLAFAVVEALSVAGDTLKFAGHQRRRH